jgi:catechol 2,3-dioxygenase-like lactoylglutathione lyase family enzyme
MNERRMRITGIHHVTLLVEDLNRSVAFYRNVLGLRLVKQTVNEDDRGARHFIFGDADGILITCLEYPDLDEGKVGRGSTHHFAFSVETQAELEAWKHYLGEKGIPTTDVMDREDFRSIYLRDPDGHIVEIAAA